MRDGMTQRALGMRRGAPDLNLALSGRFVGIEVKLPGKKHSVDHIQQQLDFGKNLREQGHEWYLITSVAGFWRVFNNELGITGPELGVLSIYDVANMIELNNRRTIKF